MALVRGSSSKRFFSAARSALRASSSPPIPRAAPAPARPTVTRRLLASPIRSAEGSLGCAASMLPWRGVAGVCAGPRLLPPSPRACCELSKGS